MRYTFLLLLAVLAFSCDEEETPGLAITSFSPSRGLAGEEVIITGSGFSTVAAENTIAFSGRWLATVKSATTTQLVVVVPEAGYSGPIYLEVNRSKTLSHKYFVIRKYPEIFSLSSDLEVGKEATFQGRYVGGYPASMVVKINDVRCEITQVKNILVDGVNRSEVRFRVPVVTSGGYLTIESDSLTTTWPEKIEIGPYVTSFTPKGGSADTEVSIAGLNFVPGEMSVEINGEPATITSVTPTAITATASTSTFGLLTVKRNQFTSLAPDYFMGSTFEINTPTTGAIDTWVELLKTDYPRDHNVVVKFNSVPAVEIDYTQGIKARVPLRATSGKITITHAGVTSTSTKDFVVK